MEVNRRGLREFWSENFFESKRPSPLTQCYRTRLGADQGASAGMLSASNVIGWAADLGGVRCYRRSPIMPEG